MYMYMCICTCMNRVSSAAENAVNVDTIIHPEVSLYILNSLNTSGDDH